MAKLNSNTTASGPTLLKKIKPMYEVTSSISTPTFKSKEFARNEFEHHHEKMEQDNHIGAGHEFGVYHTIFKHVGDGIGLSRQGEILEYTNPAARRIFGVDENHDGKIDLRTLVDETTYAHFKEMTLLRQEGVESRYEFPITRPDGEQRIVELMATPLIEHGEYNGTIGLFRDVTEHRQAEKQKNELLKKLKTSNEHLENSNKQKEIYYRVLGHDLRSPYQMMMWFGQMLLEKANARGDHEEIRIAKTMHQSVLTGFGLTQRILEWGQTQMHNKPLKLQTLNHYETIQKEIESMAARAELKNIKIQNHIMPDQMVYADADALGTVIRNLLSNAIKFSPEGETILVSSKITHNKTEGERTSISIEDHGVGMSKETVEKLFGEEMNSTRGTNGEKGTGFGLKIVKNYVKKMGGEVSVESQEGLGSTFIVSLPASEPQE